MNLNKFYSILETKSPTIKISLKNDVLVHQETCEGTTKSQFVGSNPFYKKLATSDIKTHFKTFNSTKTLNKMISKEFNRPIGIGRDN